MSNDGALLAVGIIIGAAVGALTIIGLSSTDVDRRIKLVQACQRENHSLAECLDAADRLVPLKGVGR